VSGNLYCETVLGEVMEKQKWFRLIGPVGSIFMMATGNINLKADMLSEHISTFVTFPYPMLSLRREGEYNMSNDPRFYGFHRQ